MNIEWKKNTVCYAKSKQWLYHNDTHLHDGNVGTLSIKEALESSDFQLNIPREGDYLRKEELDCESKYNDAVDVFELFGYYFAVKDYEAIGVYGNLTICYDGVFATEKLKIFCKRELTYNQLITIGKIKRLLDEQETVKGDYVKAIERVKELESEGRNIKRNKAKQAYDILQSLDYEYDLVEQRWYRKDWV